MEISKCFIFLDGFLDDNVWKYFISMIRSKIKLNIEFKKYKLSGIASSSVDRKPRLYFTACTHDTGIFSSSLSLAFGTQYTHVLTFFSRSS